MTRRDHRRASIRASLAAYNEYGLSHSLSLLRASVSLRNLGHVRLADMLERRYLGELSMRAKPQWTEADEYELDAKMARLRSARGLPLTGEP